MKLRFLILILAYMLISPLGAQEPASKRPLKSALMQFVERRNAELIRKTHQQQVELSSSNNASASRGRYSYASIVISPELYHRSVKANVERVVQGFYSLIPIVNPFTKFFEFKQSLGTMGEQMNRYRAFSAATPVQLRWELLVQMAHHLAQQEQILLEFITLAHVPLDQWETPLGDAHLIALPLAYQVLDLHQQLTSQVDYLLAFSGTTVVDLHRSKQLLLSTFNQFESSSTTLCLSALNHDLDQELLSLLVEFIRPLEKSVLGQTDLYYLAYALQELNFAWNGFSRLINVRKKSLPAPLVARVGAIHAAWNNILRVVLTQ